MARDPQRSAAQAGALYRAFQIQQRHKLEAVAQHMGVAATTLYGWTENVATLPGWAIPLLWDATHDPQLLGELLGAAERGLRIEVAAQAGIASTPSIQSAALAVGAEAGDVMRKVGELGADGTFDASDRAQLAREIDEAEARLLSLRDQLGLPGGRQ